MLSKLQSIERATKEFSKKNTSNLRENVKDPGEEEDDDVDVSEDEEENNVN